MTNPVTAIHLGHSEDKREQQGAEAIAKVFGVSRPTILRWKRAGAPIYLIGGKYQSRYDELWAWISANEKNLYPKLARAY